MADRAMTHALQKSYRDLSRDMKVGSMNISLRWQGEVDIENIPELREALDEFSTKAGSEVRQWTPENIETRLAAIASRYSTYVSTNLQFATFGIYRHSSEVLHGTLFGAMFSIGLLPFVGSPKSKEEVATYMRQNLNMVLILLGGGISALIHVLSDGLDTDNLAAKSMSLARELKSLPWFATSSA